MKSLNKLAVAAVLALSSASLASASVTIYHITGSTAFRTADVAAEVQICGGASAYATYYGTTLTGASQSVVQNAATGSATIKFENNFTGSIGGDQAIELPITGEFPNASASGEAPTQISSVGSTSVAPNGGTLVAAPSPTSYTSIGLASGDYDSALPDVVFSDVDPATTGAAIIATANSPLNTPTVTVQTEVVGIIPFDFVGIATTDITDFTAAHVSVNPENFTYTWSNGGAPVSLFTGNPADAAATVYPLGRDCDSGTRGTSLDETGYTLAGSGYAAVTNAVVQFYPLDSTGNVVGNAATYGPISSFEFVPNENVDGVELDSGDGGYASGGNLGHAIAKGFAAGKTKMAAIAYLGVSDAVTALGGSQTVLLPYNGVTFDPRTTASATAITTGQYTFWGYEYEVYKSTNSTIANEFFTQIYTDHYDQLASDGVLITNMTVGRSDDGLNVEPGVSAP